MNLCCISLAKVVIFTKYVYDEHTVIFGLLS